MFPVSEQPGQVKVCVDWHSNPQYDNLIDELNEINNCRTNIWPPLPDLVISEKHEEWVVTGESYTVHYTVKNIGSAIAPAGHDTDLRVHGETMAQKTVPVALAPGESHSDNFSMVITLYDGWDSVSVRADANEEVEELEETGNVLVNTIAWPPAPDLRVSKYEEWVVESENYTVHYTVNNRGNAQAPAGHDVSLEVDGTSIETKVIPVSLGPGQSYSGIFTTVITLSDDVDKVKVCADINGDIGESREDNNCYANTFAWPEAPDLIMRSATTRWVEGQEGTHYTVSFSVRNIGNAVALAGHDVKLTIDGTDNETIEIPVDLPPRYSYSAQFSTVITLSGGSDEVKVCADANGEVAESDETNNCRTRSIGSTVEPPDLVISEKHETWVVDGESYIVHYTVENVGGSIAPAGHHVMLEVDDNKIEQKIVNVALAPDQSHSGSFNTVVTLTGSSDSVRVHADANGDIEESDEGNNRKYNRIAWPAAPDLSVSKDEEWIVEGDNYTVYYTVRNQGNAPAPAGHDVSLEIDGTQIETKNIPVSLAPGESYDDSFVGTVTLTDSVDHINVCADIYDDVAESSEGNNCRENTFAWPPAPDLQTRSTKIKWFEGQVGTYYTVSYRVYNIGNAPAPAGHDVKLTIDGTDVAKKAIPVDLNPNNSYAGSFSKVVSLSDGSDNITVCADANTEVTESDETNNCQTKYWDWTGTLPDLFISEKHEQWSVEGESYTVHYTVENGGTATAPAGHDVMLEVDGTIIETKVVPVSLNPSDTYIGSFTTVITLTDGVDSVFVHADANGDIDELDEMNNRRYNTNAWPAAPDLMVSKWEEWVVKGESYAVYYSVRNRGNAPAAAGHDFSLEIDGTEVETKEVPVSLNPGESYSDNFSAVVTLTDGMDRVNVCADINGEVDESREENNCRINTFTWPPAPDLVIGNKWESWVDGQEGTQYTVSFSIRNMGNAPVVGGHDVKLIVDGTVIETKAVPVGLFPRKVYRGTFATVVTLSDGSDEIKVRADAFAEVAESDEANNSFTNTWPLAEVDLFIQPLEKDVMIGDTFDLIVRAEATSPVSGVQAFLNFNPNHLEVLDSDNMTAGVQVTPGTTLSTLMINSANNTAGTIDYSAGKLGEPFPTGNFTVATIKFKALAGTGENTTAVAFATDHPRETIADYGGLNITGALNNGSVKIYTQAVEISVVLEGGNRPPAGWVVPLNVRFFNPGADVMNDNPVKEFDLTATKSNGTATALCAGITPATYDITVVSEHTLMNVRTGVTIPDSHVLVNMGTLLEGNANNNDIINIQDFGILSISFMKTAADPGYDPRADFDRNGIINISDFGLMAINFMETSPVTFTPLPEFHDFQQFQVIPTNGASSWENFTIDGETYLAVANHSNGSTNNVDSIIYKWNGVSLAEIQAIPTNGAYDWESFTIGGGTYLAVSNSSNDSTQNIDSRIYKWNGTSFAEVQAIPTNGAIDWESFTIDGETYLAVANHSNGSTYNVDSRIYKWNGTTLAEIQAIPTNRATDWESFTIDGETYLAVANHYNALTFNVDSRIYKWNGTSFAEVQAIPTSGASSWESFTIDGETYLAVANGGNDITNNIDSRIYKWDSTSFAEIQAIPTNGAIDWESFTIDGETYLAVANFYNGSTFNIDSRIYQWNGTSFAEVQAIPTNGAHGWESFTINGETYITVANARNDSTYNIDSRIYKWTN
ncbi:CARDB domain-containing protein [Chloroflexota bacterium]